MFEGQVNIETSDIRFNPLLVFQRVLSLVQMRKTGYSEFTILEWLLRFYGRLESYDLRDFESSEQQ